MKKFWLFEWLIIPFKGRWYNPLDWWHIIQVVYKISRLSDPIITIFGGSGAFAGGKYVQWTYDIASKATALGMSVITGGGPGIMSAGNCGAHEKAQELHIKRPVTLGIGVYGVDPDYVNPCAHVISLPYFFMRKWFLNRYASGFVVMPGGIGTADELFEILNYMKTGKIKHRPVILVGKKYWASLEDWYKHGLQEKFIHEEFKDLFVVTDDIDEVISLLQTYHGA